MKISHLFGLAALSVIAGCDSEGVVRPPPVDVRFFHAASNIETIGFLREERVVAAANYGAGNATSFDSGPYDFSLDVSLPGVPVPVRVLTVNKNLSPDLDYTFVAVAPDGQFELIEVAVDSWPDDATNWRLSVVHAHPGLGPLDFYLEPPATGLAGATPRGTIGFGQDAVTFEFNAGTYRLYLTAPGDASDVIYESIDQIFGAEGSQALVLSDPGGLGAADIQVSRIGGNAVRVAAIGERAELRAVNAVDDRLDRDTYIDDTTSPPLFASQPFGVLSPYAEIGSGQHDIITTPAGNPGTEEALTAVIASPGRRATLLIAGNTTDGLEQHYTTEDKRGIYTQATLRLFNAAGLSDLVAFYIVSPGTDITEVSPTGVIGAPASTTRIPVVAADYEITIEDVESGTVLSGPVPVSMVNGGYYGVLLLNAADGNTIDTVLLDDFTP